MTQIEPFWLPRKSQPPSHPPPGPAVAHEIAAIAARAGIGSTPPQPSISERQAELKGRALLVKMRPPPMTMARFTEAELRRACIALGLPLLRIEGKAP